MLEIVVYAETMRVRAYPRLNGGAWLYGVSLSAGSRASGFNYVAELLPDDRIGGLSPVELAERGLSQAEASSIQALLEAREGRVIRFVGDPQIGRTILALQLYTEAEPLTEDSVLNVRAIYSWAMSSRAPVMTIEGRDDIVRRVPSIFSPDAGFAPFRAEMKPGGCKIVFKTK